mgnify:CR=1 FL=1
MAQQHMNINIPADQLEDRLCVCGNAVHVPAVSMKPFVDKLHPGPFYNEP